MRRRRGGGGARADLLSAQRAVALLRWLPPAAALFYVIVLARRLGSVVDQLTWNADYVSVMALGQSVATSGKAGRAVIIQIGYYWFDLATQRLPYHRVIWDFAPYLMTLVALGLIGWAAWRIAGRLAGMLAISIGLAASPLVLSTQAAQSFHGTTWFGDALLAAYLCWLLSAEHRRAATVIVSALVATAAGVATATDPLLLPAGDAPFAAALALMRWARPDELGRLRLVASGTTLAAAAIIAGAVTLGDRLAGYGSSFPRGLTHLVTAEHFAGNVRQLGTGIFEVAGMPRSGDGVLGYVLGATLLAGILLPMVWLARSLRTEIGAATLALLGFWSASALFVAAAFLFSDIPSDFLQNSARYLVPMFYAVAATVPLWAASANGRAALVALPAALLIVANGAAVDRVAGGRGFEPSFSPGLAEPIAFLEQHGLTRGYAAYDEASPISYRSDFALHVYPVTDQPATSEDVCGTAICPFAYNSISDWYRGDTGPTFILIDTSLSRMNHAPPAQLDTPIATYKVGRFLIYVYADDVAGHMGVPPRFTRPLL